MIMDLYTYIIYLIFALTPAALWMFFYFKKDAHPEPKRMIFKVFILGILAACLAAIFEVSFKKIFPDKSFLTVILESFFLIALVEELVKYLVVRIYVFNSPELDEPLDVMLYMVVSALGFATLENVVLFFGANSPYDIGAALSFAALRFLGAVFLHTLTSGTLGFFVALSICSQKNKKLLFFTGFFLAVIFHGFYNIVITESSGPQQYFILAAIIIILTIFTTFAFIKLKRMKGVCKISAK